MTLEKKMELIKKLKHMVAFQKDCLDEGNWEDYDKIENEIKRLEEAIIYFEEK